MWPGTDEKVGTSLFSGLPGTISIDVLRFLHDGMELAKHIPLP